MRPVFMSLSLFVLFSPVLSDDTSIFSDVEPYAYDLGFSDDQSLWTTDGSLLETGDSLLETDDSLLETDDPLLGDSIFDETSPQMLSFDGCSSGDLGMADDLGFMRKTRREDVCRPETFSKPEGSIQVPGTYPDPDETPPDDRKNNSPDPFDSFPYMPPPAFDNLGCPSLWGKVFKYTVCGKDDRNDRTPSTLPEINIGYLSYTIKNAELSKY